MRDLWVEGGEIHPGEVIELCSSPQASEGADGGRMTMAELVDVFEAFGAQGLASCDSVAQVAQAAYL